MAVHLTTHNLPMYRKQNKWFPRSEHSCILIQHYLPKQQSIRRISSVKLVPFCCTWYCLSLSFYQILIDSEADKPLQSSNVICIKLFIRLSYSDEISAAISFSTPGVIHPGAPLFAMPTLLLRELPIALCWWSIFLPVVLNAYVGTNHTNEFVQCGRYLGDRLCYRCNKCNSLWSMCVTSFKLFDTCMYRKYWAPKQNTFSFLLLSIIFQSIPRAPPQQVLQRSCAKGKHPGAPFQRCATVRPVYYELSYLDTSLQLRWLIKLALVILYHALHN